MRFSLRTFILLPLLTGTNFFALTRAFQKSIATSEADDYVSLHLAIMLLSFAAAAATLYILVRMISYLEKIPALHVVLLALILDATAIVFMVGLQRPEFQIVSLLMLFIFIAALPERKKNRKEDL